MAGIQQALFMNLVAPPAGVTLVGFTTASGSSSGVINKPVGTTSGDIIVLFAWDGNSASWSIGSPGFTDLQAGAASNFGGAYRIAGGSEPSTYFITNGGTYTGIICAVFRGPSAFDAKSTYTYVPAASNITATAVTAVAANCLLIGGFAAGGNVNLSTPSGMTFIGRATEPGVGMFYQQLSSTGSTGTRTTTPSVSGYDMGAMMLTLKP